EVLLVCESVKAISTIGATLTGRLTGKLVSVEKDARKTLNVD
ncbi:MAG: glycine cleavage system H lipoate-binding protein, partial [Candidatus Nitrosomirales archaeon]